MLSISGINYGIIVIRVSIFIVTLFAFTNIAVALNWQDKEVKKPGCPETLIGEWDSEKLNFHNEKTINIQDNKIIIIGNHNSEEYFLSNKHSFKVGGKSIEFTVNVFDQEKEICLKTQAHLITTKIDCWNSNLFSHNC
jgi:hypothetical protein